MDVPTLKHIGEARRLSVTVAQHGWPYWTHLHVHDGPTISLNREEAHDLLYAMQRVCKYLDRRQAEDDARRPSP